MSELSSIFNHATPLGEKPVAPLARNVLAIAADWHVRCKEAVLTAAEQAQLDQWLRAEDAHRRAWTLVQRLDQHLGALPGAPALTALRTQKQRSQQRRAVLKSLLLLAASGSAGWASYTQTPWRVWVASHQTQPGERRTLQLADGGVVELNTNTALDIDYGARERVLHLRAGEILIQTAADTGMQGMPRPFVVTTAQGRIRALGTRFSVRSEGERTHVAVFEHAVEVMPIDGGSPVLVKAGEQLLFSASELGRVEAVDRNQLAWTRGMLVVVDWRMADFLAELARYRSGRIVCDPAIAELRVTGAYRLDDPAHVLDSLTLSHPVALSHFTRLWVRVVPRT